MTTNVLFVCSQNQWRSPTAERVFNNDPNLAVRSAGTSKQAKRTVNEKDIAWAELILVMESHHARQLRERFGKGLRNKKLAVLDIGDEYQFMDPELVAILEVAVRPYL